MVSIEQLEVYCKQAYQEINPQIRNNAEQACLSILNLNNAFEMCQMMLERGDSPYSQIVAISSFVKLINQSQSNLTIEQRLELRNMCINYLMQRNGLVDFVVKALIGLICRITKLGWLDMNKNEAYPFREIIAPLVEMVKSGQMRPMQIGVQILYNLVYEFNQSYETEVSRSTVTIRKIANNFREFQLFDIFIVSLELLGQFADNIESLNFYDPVQHSIVNYGLRLTLACLSYDFIGTSGGEEVCDDMISVQVPTNWRTAFLSPVNTPEPAILFFKLYSSLPPALGQFALACLVQTASFRRSFFNNNERVEFLKQLMEGVSDVLMKFNQQQADGSSNEGAGALEDTSNGDCHHELCRLISRLKSNFQLGELVLLDKYPQFIELLAQFTVNSLQRDSGMKASGKLSNSQHYLLLTWQRMVASLPYLRANQPHFLDVYCPKIVHSYVNIRMTTSSLEANSEGADTDSSFDDGVGIQQELEALAMMVRCQYSQTVSLLSFMFDETIQSTSNQSASHLCRLKRLGWLVLFIGACLAGRMSGTDFNASGSACCPTPANSNNSNASTDNTTTTITTTSAGSSNNKKTNGLLGDQLDGELVGRVLQLVVQGPLFNYTDLLRSGNNSNRSMQQISMINALAGLEVAILHFLDQLRRVYLCGEASGRIARLYDVLQSRVTIGDETQLLDTIVHKLLENLRVWSLAGANQMRVVNRSLVLFHELTMGIVAKRIVQLPVIHMLLQQHSPADLPFLEARQLSEVSFGNSESSRRAGADIYRSGGISLASANSASIGASKNPRTCFYGCLTRIFLLMGPKLSINIFNNNSNILNVGSSGDSASYYTLAIDDHRSSGVLLKFLFPLSRSFDQINQALLSLAATQRQNFNSNTEQEMARIRILFLGLLRDICGVATACHSKTAYQALFDWLYPGVFSLLILAVELLATSPCGADTSGKNEDDGNKEDGGIALGCLRLAQELSLSRNNRLQSASPMGELVFRACARLLATYSRKRLVPMDSDKMMLLLQNYLASRQQAPSSKNSSQSYMRLIREATSALNLLYNMVSGNYTNLGAFILYQDDSLELSLSTFLHIMVSIPVCDVLSFPKLSRAYYVMADLLTQDHLLWLGLQQPNTILYFVNSLTDGLTSNAVAVSSSCCSALDNLGSFLLKITNATGVGNVNNISGSNSELSPLDDCHRHGLRPRLHLVSPENGNGVCLLGNNNSSLVGSITDLSNNSQVLSSREAETRSNWRYLLNAQTSNNGNNSSNNSIMNGGGVGSDSNISNLRACLARGMEILLDNLSQPDCKNQWALSRPLLPLILLDMKAFEELKQIMVNQKGDGQNLKSAFRVLLDDVDFTLTIRNRDKLTQNLNVFRHHLNGAPWNGSQARSQMDHNVPVEMIA